MNFIKRNHFKFKKLSVPCKINVSESMDSLEKKYSFVIPTDFRIFQKHLETHELKDGYDVTKTRYAERKSFENLYFIPNEFTKIQGLGFDSGYCIPYSYPGDISAEDYYSLTGKYPDGWSPKKKNNYMAIGDENGSSDFYLLGIHRETYGKVYFWSCHAMEKVNPILIADSFEEFIDGIFEW